MPERVGLCSVCDKIVTAQAERDEWRRRAEEAEAHATDDYRRAKRWIELIRTDTDAVIAELTRERDLAIAHDRQPYPTAEAYEKVCADLASARKRIVELMADGDAGMGPIK